jgi:hypothetical protein
MKAERISELRILADSDTSVTLSAEELTWLLDTHYELKAGLPGLFETDNAIDLPEKGLCLNVSLRLCCSKKWAEFLP